MIRGNYAKRMSGEKLTDHYTLKSIRSDGEIRHIEIIISTIIYNNKPAIIGTTIDITDRIEEEKRIGKAVTDAQEKERIEIGMELHDNVKQLLAGSILHLDFVNKHLDDKNQANEMIGTIKSYIREAIDELRRLSHRLAPSIESDSSLTEKIQELLNNMNVGGKLKVTIEVSEAPELLHKDIQLVCYRIIQEQFSNILKYAKATLVAINIEYNKEGMLLSIRDNGIGFDSNTKKAGIGLENIKRRVQTLGGISKILTSPGNGCRVVVQIPFK